MTTTYDPHDGKVILASYHGLAQTTYVHCHLVEYLASARVYASACRRCGGDLTVPNPAYR